MTIKRAEKNLGCFGEHVREIYEIVENATYAGLLELAEACAAPTETNCAWFTFRAAQFVAPIVQAECARRRPQKRRRKL